MSKQIQFVRQTAAVLMPFGLIVGLPWEGAGVQQLYEHHFYKTNWER